MKINDLHMYESPINLVSTKLSSDIDDYILTVVQQVGVNVDKEELVRALKYDRDQYEKGAADAIAIAFPSIRQMCMHHRVACDIYGDQKIMDVCHCPSNMPKGDSWGMCDILCCPFLSSYASH